MQGLIEYLVNNLVDDSTSVQVIENGSEDTVNIEIHVAQSDLGKVIGKQGRIANALRLVAKAAGAKSRRRVFVDIVA